MEDEKDDIKDSIFSENSPITGEVNSDDIQNKDGEISKEDKIKLMEKSLEELRDKWGKRIIDLVKEIKDVDQLKNAQVNMLSYRHMLIDHLTKFNIRLRKTETAYERSYKKKFITYFNYDYKLNDKQKDHFVNADLWFYRSQMSLLESQTDYYRECVKTLDQMGWAIKNRINIVDI